MKCRFDPTRVEKCLVCSDKCSGFMEWYYNNKEKYSELVERYVNTWPDKYQKEIIIVAKKDSPKPNNSTPQGKRVAIMNKENVIEGTCTIEEIKKTDPGKLDGKRLIELTGKEYELVISISVKPKNLGKLV